MSSFSDIFSYDGPAVDSVNISLVSDGAYIVGKNFGQTDSTLQAIFGQSACDSTSWIADSSVVCSLALNFDLNIEITEPVHICRKCLSDEVIFGCTMSSFGYCALCGQCGPGLFRDGCVPGTSLRW